MKTDLVQLAQMFLDERDRYVDAGYRRVRKARLYVGRFKRKAARDCCICDTDDGTILIHAEVLAELTWNQLVALVRHELAHVADPNLSEEATDQLAEDVSGEAIRYGTGDIQTLGRGVRPRPGRLPQW